MTKLARILLVEDDPADVLLTRKAMEKSKITVALDVVTDGEQAIQFLKQEPPFADAKRPDLILLDLNLPKVNGQQVLAEIRENEELNTLPVVVLTTSEEDVDILKSYKLGANCFVTKPVGLDAFYQIVQQIESFWFTVVRLPNK